MSGSPASSLAVSYAYSIASESFELIIFSVFNNFPKLDYKPSNALISIFGI